MKDLSRYNSLIVVFAEYPSIGRNTSRGVRVDEFGTQGIQDTEEPLKLDMMKSLQSC